MTAITSRSNSRPQEFLHPIRSGDAGALIQIMDQDLFAFSLH
jgi:hypothetical protein